MRRVLRAAAASGIGTLASIAAGLVRVKLYAVLLGAAGLGVVSQLSSLQATFTVAACLGLGIGVSRTIAEARSAGDAARLRLTASTAVLTVTGAGIVLSAALALFAGPAAGLLLGDVALSPFVRWIAIGVLFAAVGRIFGDLMNGLRDVRAVMWSSVIGSALSLVVVVSLLPALGVTGAVLSIPAVSLVGAAVAAGLLIRRQRKVLAPGPSPLLNARILAGLVRVGFASLVMGVSDQLALLAVRTDLIRRWGPAANGHFQGAFGISQQILQIAIAFHGSYSFPKVSEASSDREANHETIQALRATQLLLGSAVGALILGRHLLVRLLLSRDFAASIPLFPWQLAGDFARGTGLAVGLAILSRGGIRRWLIPGLGGAIGYVAAYAALASWAGPAAPSIAWCIASFLYLALSWAQVRRATRLALGAREAAGLLFAPPILGALAWIADGTILSIVLGVPLVLGWLMLGVRLSDVKATLAALRTRMGVGEK